MALLTVLLSVLALPLALFAWTAQSLAANTAKAKATGLPYLVRWVAPINPIWLLWGSSIVRLCKRWGLAPENSNLARIYSYGWEANERAKLHEEIGDVFFVVHPGGMELCVADGKVIYDILQRRTDFRRNMEEMAVLNVYGKNLSTTDDKEWQQHRKMTAVTFTEKNNELVWQQTLEQTTGMLEYWTQRAPQPIRSTHEDTKVFTLNVLAAALFNKVYPFEGAREQNKDRHAEDKSYQYRDSLNTILSSIIAIFICGEEGLKSWWTPKSWKHAAHAMENFRSYIFGLMNEERALTAQGKDGNQHLVARLVRACDEEEHETAAGQDDAENITTKKMALTEREILSNLFVYAFAGNDTTSITLTNLLVQLAANPEAQEWIGEEIDHYLPHGRNEALGYDLYPKFKRCLAVIMESLRVTHPLSQLVKTTGSKPQPLVVDGTEYMIPAGTSVHGSIPALHAHSKYWGPDPMKWNPHHFIGAKGNSTAASFEQEVVAADTSDHFMPWAWGQRVCPGKKFSQVELVAALVTLFRDWRVEVVPNQGESMEKARRRAWETSLVTDHQGHMLHEMYDPESVGLRWVKKGKA